MEKTLSAIATLYQSLNIRAKIEPQTARIVYLKDVWGLEQNTIAELEGISQPVVSRKYNTYKHLLRIEELRKVKFTVEELQYIQRLPREVLSDAQLIGFVKYILKLNIDNIFYNYNRFKERTIIAALHGLGVQNKHLALLFNKTTATISQQCKKYAYGSTKFIDDMRFQGLNHPLTFREEN